MRIGLFNFSPERGTACPVLQFILAFSIWILSPVPSQAGDYVVRNWSTADGLPDGTVRAIAQTPDGYLWVGTNGGIARFDGHHFEVFDTVNTPALQSNVVWDMHVDRRGVLWVATQNGVARYEDGQFEFFELGGIQILGPVWRIAETGDGVVWFLGDDGLRRLENGLIVRFEPENAEEIGTMQEMAVGPDGDLWFGSNTGLWRCRNDEFQHVTGSGRVDSVTVDMEGGVWMNEGLKALSVWRNGSVKKVPLPDSTPIHMMRALPNGDVWVGAKSQIKIFRIRGDQVAVVDKSDGLYGGRPVGYFLDRDGTTWFGLNRGGLYQLRERRVDVFYNEEGLDRGYVSTVAEDQEGQIYAGLMGGGINKFNGRHFEPFTLESNSTGLSQITALVRAPQNGLWAGQVSGPVNRLQGGRVVNTSGSRTGTRSLLVDRNSELWRGTSQAGLEHHSRKGLVLYDEDSGMSMNRIMCLAEDSRGTIWAGTDRGLNRIKDGEVNSYFEGDGRKVAKVRALTVDSNDRLWIGTERSGLFTLESGSFVSISTRNGLPDNAITQILEDDSGHLWLGTNVGLFRIALSELEMVFENPSFRIHGTFVGRNEGLVGPQFGGAFQPSCLKDSRGILWFCSNNGLVRIDPNKFAPSDQAPDVYVEGAVIDGVEVDEQELRSGQVRVAPGAKNFEIQYTALDFKAPERLRYRVRLEGYEDWRDVWTDRSTRYSQVPPGQYQFQVQAMNQEGMWNERPVTIGVDVQPTLWQTTEFRIAVAFLVLVGLVFLVRAISLRRIKRQLAMTERDRALEAERARIARDMHDELGANLTQIKLLGEQIEVDPSLTNETSQNARRISDKARDLSRGMDEIVWAINPSRDGLISFSDYLVFTAEECLSASQIRLRLDVPDDLPDVPLSSNLRHNLLLAAKEAIHNALKHSEATEVRVSLSLTGAEIHLAVVDNGRGLIEKQSAGGGNGLRNMRSRMESIGGSCIIKSGDPSGTRVALTAPFDR